MSPCALAAHLFGGSPFLFAVFSLLCVVFGVVDLLFFGLFVIYLVIYLFSLGGLLKAEGNHPIEWGSLFRDAHFPSWRTLVTPCQYHFGGK